MAFGFVNEGVAQKVGNLLLIRQVRYLYTISQSHKYISDGFTICTTPFQLIPDSNKEKTRFIAYKKVYISGSTTFMLVMIF